MGSLSSTYVESPAVDLGFAGVVFKVILASLGLSAGELAQQLWGFNQPKADPILIAQGPDTSTCIYLQKWSQRQSRSHVYVAGPKASVIYRVGAPGIDLSQQDSS